MSILPSDISRCQGEENAKCCQNCRRREPGVGTYQVYADIEPDSNGNCEHQIKKTGRIHVRVTKSELRVIVTKSERGRPSVSNDDEVEVLL